ncbi:hypothetical protein D3C81_1898370 [compost metagenome]
MVGRQHGNARASQRRLLQRHGFIGTDVALDRNGNRLAFHLEVPEVVAEVGMGQAVVPAQLLDPLRRAMLTQVAWGRAHH